MTPIVRLECGESIVLRPPRQADAPAIARYANERDVWINLRDAMPHPYSLHDAHAWIGGTLQQDPVSTFAVEVDCETVGAIGLELGTDIERFSAEIGYWIGSAYWRRGIATQAVACVARYAFDELSLLRIFAKPMAGNVASRRVLEKAGFTLEGIMRRCFVKDGREHDAALYARVRDDAA